MAGPVPPKSMKTENLECRTIGHTWEPRRTTVNNSRNEPQRWDIQLACDRCDMERLDLVDSQGRLVGRTYGYPVNYEKASFKEYGGRAGFKEAARVALFGRLAARARRKRNG